MPNSPNKLSQFWQELKRRNVTRVLAVYIAAAFMILELVDMITDPFGLPGWSLKVAFFILLAGLVIAVIVSWIYDLHSEDGIVRSEPTEKVPEESVPQSFQGWKIASYISFVVIVALIILNIIPHANNNKEIFDKSIAVLPIEYLSEDPHKQYLADGVLDAITGHLSLIEGLRVMPRTSVEQYREIKKSAKEIGKELDVSYLIEGSFLMIEDQVKLTIQLVLAEAGDHVFFKEYDRNYKDIIVVQSEVAKTIAKEIEIALTPEEIRRIEKVPTTSLTAHDFYLRGREAHWNFWMDRDNRDALKKAEEQYRKAIEHDVSFAQAYTGLAWVYWNKHFNDTFLTENFMDSALVLANKALSFDDQLSEAYVVRGNYYSENGQTDKAAKEFNRAIRINPNDWLAYNAMGWLFFQDDLVQSLDNFHKAAALNRGQSLPGLLRDIAEVYGQAGFDDKLILSAQQALELDDDSVEYYLTLSQTALNYGKSRQGIELLIKAYDLDTNHIDILNQLANEHLMIDEEEEALKYIEKFLHRLEMRGVDFHLRSMHRIGYIYWKNGNQLKADYYFSKQEEYCIGASQLGRWWAGLYFTYYDLAGVYAFRGEKEKAIENLKIFNNKKTMPSWMVYLINEDPLFDSIRDEPEFQQIVRDVEAKYQAEHERVRKWLEENDML